MQIIIGELTVWQRGVCSGGAKYSKLLLWCYRKKMLGNSQLLSLLKNYPKDDLTEKQVKRVNFHTKMEKGEELTLDKMASISKAGYGLLT